MRARNPDYPSLQQSRTSVGADGTIVMYYTVPDQPPAVMGDIEYGGGYGLPAPYRCSPANSPYPFPGCASESELVSLNISYLTSFNGSAGCFATNFTLAGSYIEPFAAVRVFGGLSDKGYIDYTTGSNRILTHQYTCPTINETRTVQLSKYQDFQCAPGFRPAGLSPEEQLQRWPTKTYCRISIDLTELITARLLQIESCPANSNPCYPATGDKARFEPDFEFAGRKFNRVYHSLRQFPSVMLPEGWRHSLEERVSGDRNSFYYLDENGYVEYFQYASDAASQAVSTTSTGRLFRRTPYNSTLGSEIISSDGDVRKFDRLGYLLSIQNSASPARNLSITYRGLDIFNDGRITAISDFYGRTTLFEYNSKDYLAAIQLPGGRFIEYFYDATGNLSEVKSEGASRTYHYSSIKGQLTGITSEAGERYANFVYDTRGRIVSSSLNADGAETERTFLTYTSDSQVAINTSNNESRTYQIRTGLLRRIAAVTSPAGANTNLYDSQERLIRHTDKIGVVTTYEYAGGNRTAINHAVGTPVERRTSYAFDSNGRMVRKELFEKKNGVLSRVQSYSKTYNPEGRLAAQCAADPQSPGALNYVCGSNPNASAGVRQSTFSYCSQQNVDAGACPLLGLVTSTNGPRTSIADTTTYIYRMTAHPGCASPPGSCLYRKGDLWKVTNALGQVTETLKHDDEGRVLSVRDPNGVITDLEYESRGWLVARKIRGTNSAVETDDSITRMEYWPTGLVKKVIQPDGAFTAYAYDTAQRLTGVSDNAGNTIQYTLDNAGNRVKDNTNDPGGNLRRTLTRVFNQLGQLQTQADAQSNPTDFTYDANGNLNAVTDALGRVTGNDYDPLGRLSRTLQNVGGINAQTQFAYDAQDNLTRVIDPKGLNTTYTYNGLGDLTQLASPDTGTTLYTYDSGGNRRTQTDARNQTSTYGYDVLNRLTRITYATSGLNVGYVYDANQAACTAASEKFSKGRLTRLNDASGSTQYCYNRFGNLVRKVQITNGIALTVRYAYTLAGQLRTVTYPDGAKVTYTRNAQGRITQATAKPAGTTTNQVVVKQIAYAPFGPPVRWKYGNNRTLQRPLNRNYQPTAVHDAGMGGLSVGLRYDPVGNLTDLTPAGARSPLVRFNYDALSRLTAFKDGPTNVAIETYTYDATGNRQSITSAGGTKLYSYPATTHRLSQVDTVPRSYDNAGNTTAIGGSAKEFVYDATGRMSQVKAGGVATMNYQYNGKGEQVRRHLDAANTYTLYDEAGQWLGDYDNTGAALQQSIWLDNMPVGLIANGNQLHYIQPDHLGTPRVVIEVARNVPVWTWDLKSEAFGNSIPNQNPDLDGNQFVLNMRFPGQRYDVASGLNQNYFREYESETARYSQSDPIGLDGGVSTYGYVGASPLMWKDPSGLVRWDGTVTAGTLAYYGAIGSFRFELESQCVNGRKAKVTVRAEGAGFGLGLRGTPPVGLTGSNVTLQDYLPDISIENLNGLFVTYGAGLTAGSASYSCNAYQIGSQWTPAVTPWSKACGPDAEGFEAGGSALWGRSRVTSSSFEKCDECEPVISPWK